MPRIDHLTDLASFWGHIQTPERLPFRNACEARPALCAGRRGRTCREARPKRSLPLWLGPSVSSDAACNPAGFDGVTSHDYWRD